MSETLERAREYAALSGPFDPVRALGGGDTGGPADAAELTAIAARLSEDCDKVMTSGSRAWLMRGVARRRILDRLASTGRLAAAVGERRRTAEDEPTLDLLDAIDGAGIFTEAAIDAAIREADGAALERLSVGLGRADGYATRRGDLPKVKSAATRLELLGAARSARRGDRPDHAEELERIIHWLYTEFSGDTPMTLYVEGVQGAGKSTLVEEVAARLLTRDDDWVVARFDFDRAGLDVQDTTGLTMELARQVAAQLPGAEAAIQQARQRAAGTTPGMSPLKGDSPERVPEELGLVLQHALAYPQRRILLVLDDLELLRARGETHPARLFSWLDQLADVTKTPIAVVGAGRGDALRSVHARVGERIVLPGLDDVGADRELERLGVDPAAREAVRAVAKGDPLTLRLAAQVAVQHGTEALSEAAGRGGMTATYLHRLLVTRLADPDLRRIIGPAVIARRLDSEVIRSVVGPVAGLRQLSPERSAELFEALSRLDWLAEPDPMAAGFVRIRADLRAVLLPLAYESAPAKSARVDRAAAHWFAERTEPWAAVEAAYHRLQAMRHRSEVPEISPSTLARLDDQMVSDLPPAAQDLVHRHRGDGSRATRSAPTARGAAVDPDAVPELRATNDRSDWVEGDRVYQHAFARAAVDASSPAGDAALTFLWRSGRWTEARRLLEQQGSWLRDEPPLVVQLATARLDTICRLEMGAESRFDAVVEALRNDAPLRDGVTALIAEPTLASLAGAGLRFALHRAGITVVHRQAGFDAVAAAVRCWTRGTPGTVGTAAADTAASEPIAPVQGGWERITARTGPLDQGGADPAVLMARSAAVLTPFADLVETMGRLPAHTYLGGYAAATQQRLEAIGNLAPAGSAPWHDRLASGPSLALQSLTDLGLLAEFAGAAAYLRRDRDLRLVASAAERWRRTIAGAWAYGTAAAPPEWGRALDVTIADRLAALLDDTDPAASAAAQLEAWAPEHASAREVLRLIRERSPASVAAAARAAEKRGPGAAASVLLRRGLPAAFVPAVAVLAERAEDAGGEPSDRPPEPTPSEPTRPAPSAGPTEGTPS